MQEKTKISIIVPTMTARFYYLEFLIKSLSSQTIKPSQIIIIAKNAEVKKIEEMCHNKNLTNISVINQKSGYVTDALNLGKHEATGDLVIFTDDDAIAPNDWIKNYVKLHESYGPQIACISSRDLLFDLQKRIIVPSYDDSIKTRCYRQLVRPWCEPPSNLFKLYKQGVYLTKDMRVVIGPALPTKICYSLPFRGVNLSFKQEIIPEMHLPEHPDIKRGIWWEVYLGIQVLLKNYSMIYVPNNPVLHTIHESISRPNKSKIFELKIESGIMSKMFADLLRSQSKMV